MYLIAQCYVPPTEREGHIVFAAIPMGVSVTLNVCLISHEPLADTDCYQIYIDSIYHGDSLKSWLDLVSLTSIS